jgi:hypothetical protein
MSGVRLLFSVLACLVTLLLLGTQPAVAGITHVPTGVVFGSFAKATDVTVEQSNGNVYVTDSGANGEAAGAVDIFGEEGGSPVGGVPAQLVGAGALGAFHLGAEPAQVGIDESSGSGHNLYVSDTVHSHIDKFRLNAVTHEYEYICQLAGVGKGCTPDNLEPSWIESAGVAVDNNTGNVLVASFGPGNGSVTEFTSNGNDVRQLSGGGIGVGAGPVGVVVSSAGDVYVNNFHRSVVRIDTEGNESFIDQNSSTAVAVDPKTNHVYVDDGTYIAEYTPEGVLLDRFGGGGAIGSGECQRGNNQCSEGLAVNGSTGDIYVSDRERGDVVVFGPAANIPDVTTGSASNPSKTTGTVSGTVNPADLALSAHYYFEYGTNQEYGGKTSEGSIGAGITDVNVSANLGELIPQTVYHYRLVAVNANGFTFGEDQTLTTLAAVTLRPCGTPPSLLPTSATLCGQIAPEGLETSYYFQYGLNSEYGAETSSAFTTQEENEYKALTGILEPGTIYHYRLVTGNLLGITFGPDETFTTPPAIPAVNDQMPSFVTGVGPHEATLHGTVNPGRGITVYHFIYGPTSAYGSSTAEAYTQLNYEDDSVEQLAANLRGGVVYHYKLIATNGSGTTVGPDETFETLGKTPLIVETGPVVHVTAFAATIMGVIGPVGEPTGYTFEFGATTNYGTQIYGVAGPDGEVAASFIGLLPDTVYHYRLSAGSGAEITYGSDQSFRTQALPLIIAQPPTPNILATPVFPPELSLSMKCKMGYEKKHGKCVKKRPPRHKKKRKKK